MKAIVLAAGRGSRLGENTASKPKCLVRLFGRPLIEWVVDSLEKAGINEIALVCGYRHELLAGYGDRQFLNSRWAQTNMVASLSCAAEWLRSEPCIVSYSDIFFLPAAVRSLVATSSPLALTYDPNWLALWSRRSENPLADAETFRIDAQRRILDIGARAGSTEEIQGQYMGLLKVTPDSWNFIERVRGELEARTADQLDMTALLSRLISAGHSIEGVAYTGCWGEVDTPDDLALYESDAFLRLSLAAA